MEDKVLKSISIALIALVAIAGFYCGAPHVIVNEMHFYPAKGRMEREHRIRLKEAITLEVTFDLFANIPDSNAEPVEERSYESGHELWAQEFDEDGNATGLWSCPYQFGGMIPAGKFEDITEEFENKLEADYESKKAAGLEAYREYRFHLLLWFMYPDVGGNLRRGLVVGIPLLFFGILLYRLMSKGKIYFIACWSTVLFLVISLNLFFTMPCR